MREREREPSQFTVYAQAEKLLYHIYMITPLIIHHKHSISSYDPPSMHHWKRQLPLNHHLMHNAFSLSSLEAEHLGFCNAAISLYEITCVEEHLQWRVGFQSIPESIIIPTVLTHSYFLR